MRFPKIPVLAAAAALGLLTACASTGPAEQPGASSGSGTSAPSSAVPTPLDSRSESPSAAASSPRPGSDAAENDVAGTIVRFTSDDARVDVTIDQDTPAVRDFLSMLPLTLDVEELSGREKIAYLPRELDVVGTPGSDPEDGDLIYYTPWGNLGFYYDASGIEYSDQTLHLGTYDATLDQLNRLEGAGVTIEIAH
ncbi:cyclophilin-like fold protein [Promicromonospora soli]|uniref:Cyclophilin-like domain-containing protein n=1 Tax=Promicromonospora soli TaxID=2035533 RepID=A0A919FZY0_9MICO|nr:cyclophilin-like fold protein [Promicromonospora soli]GHH75044.1 hypothetical protein GCM10017772_30410 [Promicromonospora soli]